MCTHMKKNEANLAITLYYDVMIHVHTHTLFECPNVLKVWTQIAKSGLFCSISIFGKFEDNTRNMLFYPLTIPQYEFVKLQ